MEPVARSFLANLLGLPAATVPIGLGQDSLLPIGFQFLGEWWEEAKLARLGCALEQAQEESKANERVRPPVFWTELDTLLLGKA